MINSQENQRGVYYTLQASIAHKLAISWSEYVLLDMVAKLSIKDGYCYKSMTSMAADMMLSFNGTKKIVQRLVERELLVLVPGGLQCGQAYIDTLTEYVPDSKTAQSATTAQSAKPRTALSAKRLHKVQRTALSSGKNNNIEGHKNNSINSGDMSPVPVDPIAAMYYQVIKQLRLPVKNHNNVKAAISKLKREDTPEAVTEYLTFMLNQYEATDWPYKPAVNEALDIHGKRMAIISSIKQSRKQSAGVVIR